MDDPIHTGSDAATIDVARPLTTAVAVLALCAFAGLLAGAAIGLLRGSVAVDVLSGVTLGTAIGGLLAIVPVLRMLRTLP